MKYRVLTHGGCTSLDGFASAYIFKKYFTKILDIPEDLEVIGINPEDYKTIHFSKGDIVLDLPKPKENIFFWCDHHATGKLEGELPENHYWELKPSCAGYLIELAYENGVQKTEKLEHFREAIDNMDSANYTLKQIKDLYYHKEDKTNLNALEKAHLVSSMIHTKDKELNKQLFKNFLSGELAETPIDDKKILGMNPLLFHQAQLNGYDKWREWAKDIIQYNSDSKTVILDLRDVGKFKGNYDRFFSFVKFTESSYSVKIQEFDNGTRISIGSNIFHKDRCKVDIGKLCENLGNKFGNGIGGGHYGVGGCTIKSENTDKVLKHVLNEFSND